MEREIELTCGKRVIVRSPGLHGEVVLWDFIAACEPFIEVFKGKLKDSPCRDETKVFFIIAGILRENWTDLTGIITQSIQVLTRLDEQTIREDLNLADKMNILRAGWEVMGLGKLMDSVGMGMGASR